MRTRFLPLVLLAVPVAASAANITVSHHGRLLDASEQPVTGPVDITFNIFKTSSEANEVPTWTETYRVTASAAGAYAVDLGDTLGDTKKSLPDSVFASAPKLYLGVKIGDAALTPRMLFSAAPLAGRATSALKADTATHAETAGAADTATHATSADTAASADKAKAVECTGCITKDHLASGILTTIDAASVAGKVPSATPAANGLLLLDGNGKLPVSAFPGGGSGGIDASTLNGFSASSTPEAGKILVLDSAGKLPLAAFPGSGGSGGIDAASLGGKAANLYALKTDIPIVKPIVGTPSALDVDGDGKVDGAYLPSGFFQNRSMNTRTVYQYAKGGTIRFTARDLNFLKKSSTSLLELTATHSGGFHMTGTATDGYYQETILDERVMYRGATHANTGGGWRLWPQTVKAYVPNVPAGVHNLKHEFSTYYVDHLYWAWTGFNNFEVRELPATEKRGIRYFNSDKRTTSTSFVPVEERQLTYTKQTTADVLVTVTDVWGAEISTGNNPGCSWKLYIDGSASPDRGQDTHHSTTSSWTMYPMTYAWIVTGLSAQAHSFEVRALKQGNASQCANGWNGNGGNISVLELDSTRSAHAENFPDASLNSSTWTDAPNRTVNYTKKDDGATTDLRISYMDNVGYQYAAHATAGHIRVLMDGNEVGVTSEHTEAVSGWRLLPKYFEWVVPDVPAGAHVFKIQYYKEAGASPWRLGWNSSGTGAANFLLVQETARND